MAQRPPRRLTREELLSYATGLLSSRALSTSELRTRLVRRAADSTDTDQVLAKLSDLGFLDDKRFAENFAGVRRDSGSFGSQRVLRDLRQKRVAAPLAQAAVTEAYADTDEVEMVREWLRRKLRGKPLQEHLADQRNLASAYRRLRYAGFSAAASMKGLREFSSLADELEDEPIEGTE